MPEEIFSLANKATLLSWVCLMALPRFAVVLGLIRWGVIGSLCLVYAVIVSVQFFRVDGGGYFTLEAVQALFASPHVALAGWVHYLAFDLFVGLWIAERADGIGLARLVQVPILLATFMFGPVGLLLFYAVQAGRLTNVPKITAST